MLLYSQLILSWRSPSNHSVVQRRQIVSVSKKVLVAAMFVAAVALVGCGSNSITAPEQAALSVDHSLQLEPVAVDVRPTFDRRETLHPSTVDGDSTIISADPTPPPPPPSTPPPPDVRPTNPHKTIKVTMTELKQMYATSTRR